LLQVVEVPGCGHAPALNVPQHYALVDGFLAQAQVGGQAQVPGQGGL
jgi:hypothetical protein